MDLGTVYECTSSGYSAGYEVSEATGEVPVADHRVLFEVSIAGKAMGGVAEASEVYY